MKLEYLELDQILIYLGFICELRHLIYYFHAK